MKCLIMAAAICTQLGTASWYGPGFHGRETANGETYNKRELTAASRKLPLGSRVDVLNLKNGLSVTLRINDRGPYVGRRIIDVSERAAEILGFKKDGLAPVRVTLALEQKL